MKLKVLSGHLTQAPPDNTAVADMAARAAQYITQEVTLKPVGGDDKIVEGFLGNQPGSRESKIVADEIVTTVPAYGPAGVRTEPGAILRDRDLLQQCRQGDMQAFAVLVERYQDRLFNATYRICGNYQDACELTQEAFLRALKNISGFRGDAKFYTWLFRIAVNLVRSHQRRIGRRRTSSLDRPDGTLAAASQAASLVGEDCADPAQRIIQAERDSKVVQALGQLAQEYRTAIVLRDVQGLDYRQIAEVLDVPVGTVKSRVHRGRLALRDLLAGVVQ